MKLALLSLVVAFTSAGCATHRYGRLQSLTEIERETLTCEQLEVEVAKAEQFLQEIKAGAPAGKAVLGVLGDFGIGNAMERDDARKSGERRLRELQEARYRKGCPGAQPPEALEAKPGQSPASR
jgi:hypothetical protein